MLLGIQIFGRKMLSPREMVKALGTGSCDLSPSHFGLLTSVDQQAKKGGTMLAGVIDHDLMGG